MDRTDVQKKQDGVLHQHTVETVQNRSNTMDSIKRISWSAVFAGVLIAVVVQIALSLLGLGIGLSTIDPKTEANPTDGLGMGSAIWYVVSNLISLFAGGWVAGRLTQARRPFDGMIHGLLTWSLLTLVTLYLLTSAIGSVLGGAGKLLGNTLSAAGNVAGKGIQAAAPAIGDKLQEEGINIDNLKQQAQTLLRQTGKPALQPGALNNQADAAGNAASNTAGAMGANPQQSDNALDGLMDNLKSRADGVTSEVDKQAMVNIIVARTGKSPAEANQIADNWITTYKQSAAKWEQTKKEAAAKARDIADKAAKTASTAAILTFFSLLLGAAVSAFGARSGTNSKDNTEKYNSTVASA